LADLGFKEDEIVAIQEARRAAGNRSPRPLSPASINTISSGPSTQSVLSRPNTRTTSLPRHYTDQQSISTRPSLPSLNSSSSVTSQQNLPPLPQISAVGHSRTRTASSSSLSHSFTPESPVGDAPSTPPRRKLVVANYSSPPPAYSVATADGNMPNLGYPSEKSSSGPAASSSTLTETPSTPSHQRQNSGDSDASAGSSSSRTTRKSKRLTILPPRLSLHNELSLDLSDWGEGLFSSIGTDLSTNGAGPSTIPSIITPDDEGERTLQEITKSSLSLSHNPPPASPLWHELSHIVGSDVVSVPDVKPGASSVPSIQSSPIRPLTPESRSRKGKSPDRRPTSAYRIEDAEDAGGEDDDLYDDYLSAYVDGQGKRDSSRSSTSTLTAAHATVVENVTFARRAIATPVMDRGFASTTRAPIEDKRATLRPSAFTNFQLPEGDEANGDAPLASPVEDGGSSSSGSQDYQTQTPLSQLETTQTSLLSSAAPSPDPTKTVFPHREDCPAVESETLHVESTDSKQEPIPLADGSLSDSSDEEDLEDLSEAQEIQVANVTRMPPRSKAGDFMKPTIVINNAPLTPGLYSASHLLSATPVTPRYRGWVSEVLKPLEDFIDDAIDPRDYYHDLQEIAEGDSGSVFAARLANTPVNLLKLKVHPRVKAQDQEDKVQKVDTLVAIKKVAILPDGSDKLRDLKNELILLKGLDHPNLLSLDALYIDSLQDSLWIRMELLERSLADVIGLVEHGLILQDRVIARFASDVRVPTRVFAFRCGLLIFSVGRSSKG